MFGIFRIQPFRQSRWIILSAGLIGSTVAISLGQDSLSLQQRHSESRAVENYLKSLGLNDLVIEHLEIETAREINREARQRMASRLISEYAQRMLSSRGDSETDWQSKAELLLKTYPELSTPTIQIAILQSKYVVAENELRKWWTSGRDENGRAMALRWHDLIRGLESLGRQLNAEYEDQMSIHQTMSDGRDSQAQRLARIEGVLFHTDYLLGWSFYYLGVLTPERRKQLMTVSDSHFRTFLQIEPNATLTEVPPGWFDFTSDLNARALVGLAMSQRGLNHPMQSHYCFELVQNHATSQQTRDLRFVWDLNSRMYLNEVSAAQELVDSLGEARNLSEPGRTAFWMATLNSGVALRSRAPVISDRLIRAGLRGLARQSDAERLRMFLKRTNIELSGQDFLTRWVSGFLELNEAATSGAPKGWGESKSKLTAALASVDDETDRNDIARCRFLLAKVQLFEGEFLVAANTFLECSESLFDVAPELSAESQWLAVRCLAALSRTHSRYLIQANRTIDRLMHQFPGSTFAKRAEFEKLRLNVTNTTPEQMIIRLARIPPEDVNYRLAATEIVKIRYTSWVAANREESSSESEAFQALLDANSLFQKLAAADAESKVKSHLLIIDAMLRTDSIDDQTIHDRLDQISVIAAKVANHRSVYQEFRYYQFVFANRINDQDGARAEALWLAEHAQGTRFEKSAMIQLARLMDQQLTEKSNPTHDELVDAIGVYEKLVELLGTSESQLEQSPNARVAFARLAALKLKTGSSEEAMDMLISLNEIFPNHKSYLRQLATTYTQSQHYAPAIPIWQKLIRGVDSGSDVWLESKYNLAWCLFHSGLKDEARQVHEQTRRLAPELPDAWIKPFDELSTLLTGTN